MPDDVLLLILNKVDVEDYGTLLSATVACKAFNRIAPPTSPIWKKAFFGKMEPPEGTRELKALKKEIRHFGGYKHLLGARLLKWSPSITTYPKKSMLFNVRTTNGTVFMWGGGIEESPLKEESSKSSDPPYTSRNCQLKPLFQGSDMDELIKDICPTYTNYNWMRAVYGTYAFQTTILLEAYLLMEGCPGRIFYKLQTGTFTYNLQYRNTSIVFGGFLNCSTVVFQVPSCGFTSKIETSLLIKGLLASGVPNIYAGRFAEDSRDKCEGTCRLTSCINPTDERARILRKQLQKYKEFLLAGPNNLKRN